MNIRDSLKKLFKLIVFYDFIESIFWRVIISAFVALTSATILYFLAVRTFQFLDNQILLAVSSGHFFYFDVLMTFVTYLAGPIFIVLTAAILLLYFWIKEKYFFAIVLAVSGAGSYFLKTGLKLLYARPRPDIVVPLVEESSFSFPSGHALAAVVFYGFLAWIIARGLQRQNQKAIVWTLVILLVLLIGFSRVYLGVHWLSDVLAGYIVGVWWLYTVVFVGKKMLARWHA